MAKKKLKILQMIVICILLIVSCLIIKNHYINDKNDKMVSIGAEAESISNTSNVKTEKGTIEVVNNFYSSELDNEKTIRIYLPYGYEKSNKKYPVVYMPDGQNLFDVKTSQYGKEWKIDETLDRLYTNGKNDGIIIVGVDSLPSTRTSEYNIFSGISPASPGKYEEGKGDRYAKFIVNTLKPYIDKNYRTLSHKENTAIIGSSYGAIISMYTGITYHDIFGMIGAFSFCDNVDAAATREYLSENLTSDNLKDTKIYFYSGTDDFAYQSTQIVYKTASSNGLTKIKYEEDHGSHDEISWANKVQPCLLFFEMIKE